MRRFLATFLPGRLSSHRHYGIEQCRAQKTIWRGRASYDQVVPEAAEPQRG